MGKKKSKKAVQAVYLAPPRVTPKDADKVLDYDPETKAVDEFEQDLDFLLTHEEGKEMASLEKGLEDLQVEDPAIDDAKKEPKKLSNNKANTSGTSQHVTTKRIRKEILDFDISFSDDEEDTPIQASLPKPSNTQQLFTKKQQQTPSASTNTKTNRPCDDPFKSSEEYFKKEFGLSETDSEDAGDFVGSYDEDDELEEGFKFQFVVSDEEEQIQLDEEHNKKTIEPLHVSKKEKRRSKKKPSGDKKHEQGQQNIVNASECEEAPKTKYTRKPKKPSTAEPMEQSKKDHPKPLTRTNLLNNRKSKDEDEKKQKTKGPKPEPEKKSYDKSKSTDKPKRKPGRRAPTALKETATSCA